MAVDSVSITNSKQILSVFHEVLNTNIGILIHLIFFLWAVAGTGGNCKFGYDIIITFFFTCLENKVAPLTRFSV